MPHYKDGVEAKVGDQVYGRLYNTPGLRAGTIVSLTPGVESCNAMVAFLVLQEVTDSIGVPDTVARMGVWEDDGGPAFPRVRCVRTEAHGSAGPVMALVECADYCAVNELTKIGP